MSIHESGENYLEQIFVLSKQKETVRAVDLSKALGFSRPTVSVMLRELRQNGFVVADAAGALSLTEAGTRVAQRMYERHCMLSDLLISLGVSRETALEDACKVEHDLSNETFACIKKYCEGLRAKEQAE